MRKMGWREGEGLGKNKEGNKEPILVDFKTDRKGNKFFFRLFIVLQHLQFHCFTHFWDLLNAFFWSSKLEKFPTQAVIF